MTVEDILASVAAAPSSDRGDDWCVVPYDTLQVWKLALGPYVNGGCPQRVDSSNDKLSFFCNLPRGHTGPCIGWSASDDVHVKDRLSYRAGLMSALRMQPYTEE